ncbi:MAG: serine/threonine protein kinase [Archangium sp.]
MSERVGRYDVLAQLTKGGMAELSLASTQGPGGFRKFVVIKRILPEAAGDENFVKMFLDEARVTGAFSHPSICQVFELGNDQTTGLFVAMEFIAGQDLNQVVAACAHQQAVLPVGYSASVVLECAQALHYAHTFKLPNGEESPVIHRDVAQKNIMVTYDGQVKLLDFGIAKAKGALARTRAGTVKGTAGYMSPEQVRGEQIDGRSDVFALGVVLWEMVTGRRLFAADTELAELKMILSEPIRPPHEVEPSVPQELSNVAMKALERDVNQRYRSAREMARALTTQCGHLLFDAEERADFMKQRFSAKIEAAQRLFDTAGAKDQRSVTAAAEAFRKSSSTDHERDTDEGAAPAKPKAKAVGSSVSDPRMRAVKPGASTPKLKPARPRPSVKRLPKEEDFAPTEASVVSTPPPSSASKVWPVLAVVIALAVGAGVFLAMNGGQKPPPPPRPEQPVAELPGVDSLNGELPGVDSTPTPNVNDPPPDKKVDPTVRPPVREKGEITLVIPSGAVITKGKQKLAEGSMMSFTLPVGTHLLTVTGDDGVRRKLSLQVPPGKSKAQRFRLEDIPPE